MPLLFDAYTEIVDCGSGASLDAHTTGTMAAWIRPSAFRTDDNVIVGKADTTSFTAYRTLQARGNAGATAGDVYCDIQRASGDLVIRSSGNEIVANAWQFAAITFNTGGANGDQHAYYGRPTTGVAEVAGYTTQTVGSGAVGSDAAYNLGIGNFIAAQDWANYQGQVAWVGIWNRQLALRELREQWAAPRVTPGCVGFWWLGRYGAGLQLDWSGRGNHGAVTGATPGTPAPVRFGPPRAFVRRHWFLAHPAAGAPPPFGLLYRPRIHTARRYAP